MTWKTLNTPHFEVIYPENYDEQAQLYANYAEKAHELLFPIFKEGPEKTLLILDDSNDTVNGFASFFPYPFIVVYLNLPNPLSDISSYEDWAEMLLIHEFAHVLNMYPAHGFYTPLKYIFGSIIHPNGVLPRWYLEGLSVELESRLTQKGRLKSYSTDALLRTLVQENLLRKEGIDRINQSNIPEWPGGRRPYLFGSLLMKEILNFNNEPDENIYYLNQRYSRRLPFFITGPLDDMLGYDWVESLDQVYSKIEQSANYQIKIIEQGKQRKFESFNFEMDSQLSPSQSPDGNYLAFVAGNYHDGFGIYLNKYSDGNKTKKIISGAGMDKISWLPDSSGFVFAKQQGVDHYNNFGDLFFYDLNSEKVKKLTHKARALEPEVSIDGRYVYFIQSGNSRSALARFAFENSQVEILWQTPFNHRLYSPTAMSLNQVVVGYKGTKTEQQAFLFDDITRQKTSILSDVSSIHSFKSTQGGLLFVSEKSGVPNLYFSNKSFSEVTPLTNSTTAILNGDYSVKSKKLVISQYSKKGPQLYFAQKLKRVSPTEVPPLFQRTSLPTKKGKSVRYKLSSDIEDVENLKVYENSEYSSSKFLIPQYWIPFIYQVEGGVLFQAMTSAGDPLGKQSYSLGLSYDSLSEALSGALSYLNQMTRVGLGFNYGLFNEYRNSSKQEIKTESISLNSYYNLSSDHSWKGLLGGYFAETEKTNTNSLRRLGASLGLTYNSSGHFDIQPRDNILALALFYQNFIRQEGYLDYDRLFSQVRYDLKKPLPSRHTFSSQLVNSYAHSMNIIDSLFIGDTSLGGNYNTNLVNSSFLLRGYPTGTFVGRSMSVLNLEYSFPVYDIYKGWTTSPVFANEVYGSLFIDALTVDGAAYSLEQNAYFRKRWGEHYFASTGAELVLGTTLGFHLPAYFKFGFYYGFDQDFQGGSSLFFSFGFGEFESLGGKPTKTTFYK